MDTEIDLKSTLTKMGLGDIFSQRKADFSRITSEYRQSSDIVLSNSVFYFIKWCSYCIIFIIVFFLAHLAEEPLCVSKVLQRVKMEVNEEGTKGSSATGTKTTL